MTTTTTTLADFLLARIAEDEAAARAAGEGLWAAEDVCVWRTSPIHVLPIVTSGYDNYGEESGGAETPAIALHIARHDPTRVLAECEAKRRIVEACTEEQRAYGLKPWREPVTFLGRAVLHALALPYADHPDYREEWKP